MKLLRAVMVLAAWEAGFLAFLTWRVREVETFFPLLWPILFSMGAFGSLVLACSFRQRWAVYVSVVGLVCGHFGRSLIVLTYFPDEALAFALERSWIGATVHGMLAVMFAYVWLTTVNPIVAAQHRERRRLHAGAP